MSTNLKEWLQQTIAELEEERNAVPGAVNEDAARALAAMKLALASLDSGGEACEACGGNGSVDIDHGEMGIEHIECPKFYTSQPAPVSVPDDVLKGRLPDAEKAEFWFEHNGKILFEGVKFNNAVFDACRAAMLQGAEPDFREISNSSTKHFRENAETSTKCWCRTCRPVTFADSHFVVCPECGNKRCPHANDHRHACTGSNEPGQEGSAYPAAPQQEVK